MKILLSSISYLLICSSLTSFSQLPDSIAITTEGSWIIEHSETNYTWIPETGVYDYVTELSYDYYRSGVDTIIAGTTYTKLLHLPIYKESDGSFNLSEWATESYYLAYRNEDGKAYRLIDSSEELWYDFTLDVSDTLWNPATLTAPEYLTVSEIDSIPYCDQYYRNFHFNELPYRSIQRVGSTVNFLHNYADPFIADKLVSFCESADPFESVVGVSEEEEESLATISLYPNPVQNEINLSMSENEQLDTITIRDLTGRIVFQDQSGETNASVEHLPSGTYLVQLQTSKREVVLKFVKL